MTTRFVSLVYRNGKPLCAPVPVSIEGRHYEPCDIEFEEAALHSAIRDGLIASRGEVIAAVRTAHSLSGHNMSSEQAATI